MNRGDLHVDLRDRTVVEIRRVFLPSDPDDSFLVEVRDVPRGFTFIVDAQFLSSSAVDMEDVMEWLARG